MGEILEFKRDHNYYFKKGTAFIANGNFFDAVKNIREAIKLCDNLFLKSSYYLVLAQAYSKMNLIQISNRCYYKALDFDSFSQIAFLGLGENFFLGQDMLMAQYYLNLCLRTGNEGPVIQKANMVLKEINKSGKKFRVIKTYEEELNDKFLNLAEKHMLKGGFDKAIENFLKVDESKLKEKEKNQLRSGLSFAYFFTGNHQKGIELSESVDNKTTLDLCNLMLLYYYNEDAEKLKVIREEILSKTDLTKEDTYKIAISFAHIKEHNTAKHYIEKVLKEDTFSTEIDLLYAIACLNCGEKYEAKKQLLKILAVDPENSYIYKKYLNLCDKPNIKELDYVFGLQYSEYLRVNRTINNWLEADIDLLDKLATENIDFLYYIVKHISGKNRNLLLLRLCEIDRPAFSDFFEDLLLDPTIEKALKVMIITKRIEKYSIAKQNYVVDDYYNRIALPSLMTMKVKEPTLFSSVIIASEFLMDKFLGGNINIKTEVYTLSKALEKNDLTFNKYILASIISWLFVREKGWCTLKVICNHFVVDEREVLEAIEKLGIEQN